MLKKVILLLALYPSLLFSQEIDKLNVYLDCNYICDIDFLKREMPCINFMRDPSDSHVQIIVKSQKSASGGSRISLRFIGSKQFNSKEDEYFINLKPDISKENQRQEILEMLKRGLFYYLLRSNEAKNFNLDYIKSTKTEKHLDLDKWKNWVFRLNLSAWIDAEKGYTNSNYNSTISINKIKEKSKFLSNFRMYNSITSFDYPDYKLQTEKKNSSADFTYVKSLSPKFSLGAFTNISRSTYYDYNLKLRFEPAIEYNFYPYDESSKHRLSMLYGVGFGYNDYIDSTIYLKTEETFPLQQVEVKYNNLQKWGSIGLNLYSYQIIDIEDMDKYYFNHSDDIVW